MFRFNRNLNPTLIWTTIKTSVLIPVPLFIHTRANPSKAFRGDPLVKMYWDRVYGPKVPKIIYLPEITELADSLILV